ncbi:MAG TPA: alpha/beta hydrolase [Chloroflexaceae bacterium]|nr:alpha/beta hydrolase [Chloroflexaceae bacterium]
MTTASPGTYLEVARGVELYYEEHGAGTPLVVVPGWTFTTEVFQHQVAHFAQSHRVIVVDPRSQGRSSKSAHGNDYATHGADLARLFAALELRDAVLVGWSTGTLDALGYVQQAGTGALRALVGIDMSPKPLAVSGEDWVEGPLDEIAGAWRAFLRSPQASATSSPTTRPRSWSSASSPRRSSTGSFACRSPGPTTWPAPSSPTPCSATSRSS